MVLKKKNAIALCVAIPFLIVVFDAVAAVAPLAVSYNKNAYEKIAIVEKKRLSEIYDLADYAFKPVKTNISLTELTGVITSVVRQGKSLSNES